jgi:hypothetical protein
MTMTARQPQTLPHCLVRLLPATSPTTTQPVTGLGGGQSYSVRYKPPIVAPSVLVLVRVELKLLPVSASRSIEEGEPAASKGLTFSSPCFKVVRDP